MTICYDSVTGDAIPANAAIVAGYIDGPYGPNDPFGSGWSAKAWARYPNAQHVTITVKGAPGALAADCESGDLTPATAAAWAKREVEAGRRPTVYAAAWFWANEVDQALAAVGLERVRDLDGWVAHEGAPAKVPGGFVAIQYAQDVSVGTGHNVDISVTDGTWPAKPKPPVPLPVIPPTKSPRGADMLHTITIPTDNNGDGFAQTTIPWSTFMAVSLGGSDPAPNADNTYWPGAPLVQNRGGNVLVSVVGARHGVNVTVFVLATA